ncbi:MAG: hypothetical protein HKN91_14430 [Acidimicrobiia bacterium]|nr:hypothetical protein [Acidimicrobiia bacterium]
MTTNALQHDTFDLEELLPTKQVRVRLRPWFVFAFVVILAFFGLIFSRVSLDRSGFELDDLETQIAIEEARHWDLRAEVARLQDPHRISEIAAGLGLVYPDERVALEVPGIESEGLDDDYRWAQLKAVLTAQP